MRIVVATLGCGGAVAALAIACIVDVDEKLLDRADARVEREGGELEAGPDGGAYVGLPCGTKPCQPPGQVCCATKFGDPDIVNGVCSTRDLCNSGDYFACTSSLDCEKSGQGNVLCCAVHDRGAFNVTKCASSCDTTSSILCDPTGRPCVAPRTCRASPEFPHLYECLVPP